MIRPVTVAPPSLSYLLLVTVDALPLIVGSLAARTTRMATRDRWLLGAITYALLYSIAEVAPHLAGPRVGHWNWLGKAAGIAVSLACWRAAGLTRDEVGWRLPRTRIEWAVAAGGIAVLAGLSTVERLAGGGVHSYDTETLVFQATMPGLDEELAYRGVLLAMLIRAFPSRCGICLAAGLVTALF